MNGHRQSDGPVVPANPPNKATAAEVGEGRGSTKGNTTSKPHPGRSAGPGVSHALDRVRQAAARDKKARFTAFVTPRQYRPAAGGLPGDQPEGGAGGG